MQKLNCDLLRAIFLFVCMMIFSGSNAIAQNKYRRCTIKEIIDSGGYSYIRCYDGSGDIWLATPQQRLNYGEKVTFEDAPPMSNFTLKSLSRTFPLIRFTSVMKYDPQKNNSPVSNASSTNNGKMTVLHNDDIYSGVDDNGTIVFSDDPSKAPKSAKVQRRTNKIRTSGEASNISSQSPSNSTTTIKSQKDIHQTTTMEEHASNKEHSDVRGQATDFNGSSLVNMWNSMVSCLSRGDTAKALSYMHPSTRQQYKEMFAELNTKLPGIMSTQRSFSLSQVREEKVIYELTTTEQDGVHSYDVVFVKDDSKWWIYIF